MSGAAIALHQAKVLDDAVIRGIRLADGHRYDLTIRRGRFTRVVPAGVSEDHDGLRTIDATGWLGVPPLVEPHIHLDKALTVDSAPNHRGDLAGAIEAWMAYRPAVGYQDVRCRARKVLRTAAFNGVIAVRTHVDTGVGASLGAVQALIDLRRELQGIVDMQIVAAHGLPVSGPGGAPNTALLRQALDLGADAIGGAPSLDPNPVSAYRILSDLAHEFGVPLDLHVDETLEPGSFLLGTIAQEAVAADVPITVGHIVSLSVQDAAVRRDVSKRLADGGVTVVTLPQTNLYLQGRGQDPVRPRGVTAVDDLLAAGVTVAAGSDNIADPFNPLGRVDPFETASLLISTAHVDLGTALSAVGPNARKVLGLPAAAIAEGFPADFLAIRAESAALAVAQADPDRILCRAGTVIAATTSERWWSVGG